MKFSKFILIMSVLSLAGSAAAAGLDSRNVPVYNPGSTAEVQFKADLPESTSALQFTVTLPEAFELESENLVLNSPTAAKLQTRVYKKSDNTYNYVLYSNDNLPIDTSSDYLFGLKMRAKSTSGRGFYALLFSKIIAATAGGSETRIADFEISLQVKIPATQISVIPDKPKILIGETQQLTAKVFPADAEQSVSWEVSDPAIASVDDNGLVRGLAVGQTRITARPKDGSNVAGYCNLTVDPILSSGISLDKSTVSLRAGAKATLHATVTPANTTNPAVAWSSSDSNIVSVDENGNLSALKAGEATISAITADGSNLTATCKVTVLPPLATAVTLSKNSISLTVRESVMLAATVSPTGAEQRVNWHSSDTKIATVEANGLVTAVASGSAVITATSTDGSGISATCVVNVSDAKVTTISLNKTALGMRIGQSETLTATALPDYAANRLLTWTSDKPEVATVDTNGKVTAVNLGQAIITAAATDGSGVTATCTVTVTNALATGVTIDRFTTTLSVDESVKLTATVTPSGAANAVNWSSDLPAVATVDKDGIVSAISPGSAIITATTADGTNLTATCIITVKPVEAQSLTLSATDWSGKVGETMELTATVLPVNTTDKTITWSSSAQAVAIVNSNGKVTAIALGEAVITARCGDATASCAVTIIPTPAEKVTLSVNELKMLVGAVTLVTATVYPDDASYKELVWSSSDVSVVSVSQDGRITAISEGEAVVRAETAEDATIYDECIITVSKETSGIEDIVNADTPYEIYDLTGLKIGNRLDSLERGFYIVRQGNSVMKIVIN